MRQQCFLIHCKKKSGNGTDKKTAGSNITSSFCHNYGCKNKDKFFITSCFTEIFKSTKSTKSTNFEIN